MAVEVVTNIHHDEETGSFAYSDRVNHSDAAYVEERAGVLTVFGPLPEQGPQEGKLVAIYARDAWQSARVAPEFELPVEVHVRQCPCGYHETRKVTSLIERNLEQKHADDCTGSMQPWKPVSQSPQADRSYEQVLDDLASVTETIKRDYL